MDVLRNGAAPCELCLKAAELCSQYSCDYITNDDGVEIQANIGTGEKNQPRYDEFFELCGCKWCLENV